MEFMGGETIAPLSPSVLNLTDMCPVTWNTNEPIPFETDLFKGKLLLLTPSPKYDISQRRKPFTVEMQFQGMFKTVPPGQLFVGGEITKKMELGMITRSLCKSIMKYVGRINNLIHHSFGDDSYNELPHIVGPLWSLADMLFVTAPGETPPALGSVEGLREDMVARAQRRSQPNYQLDIDLASTYTFSFNTNNVDLADWTLNNIPLMGSLDLHTFWSTADIRIVIYQIVCKGDRDVKADELPVYHLQKEKDYCALVELKHVSNHHGSALPAPAVRSAKERLVLLSPSLSMDQSKAKALDDAPAVQRLPSPKASPVDEVAAGLVYSNHIASLVPCVIEVEDGSSAIGIGSRKNLYAFRIPSFVVEAAFGMNSHPTAMYGGQSTGGDICMCRDLVVFRSGKLFKMLLFRKASYESSFVPPVYFSRMSKLQQKRVLYQFVFEKVLMESLKSVTIQDQLIAFFALSPNEAANNRNSFMHLLSKEELPYEDEMSILLVNGLEEDDDYGPRLAKKGVTEVVHAGPVLVNAGPHVWSEEYLVLTKENLQFVPSSSVTFFGSHSRVSVPLGDILSIEMLEASNVAMGDVEEQHRFQHILPSLVSGLAYYFVITTLPKEYVLWVRTSSARLKWMECIRESICCHRPHSAYMRYCTKFTAGSTPEAEHVFTGLDAGHCSRCWSNEERIVLNTRSCRLLTEDLMRRVYDHMLWVRGQIGAAGLHREKAFSPDLPSFVESLLCIMLGLVNGYNHHAVGSIAMNAIDMIDVDGKTKQEGFSGCRHRFVTSIDRMDVLWLTLFEGLASLQSIDVIATLGRDSDAFICVLLNLYHILLLHGVMMRGSPKGTLTWIHFFSTTSYALFGDVVSLCEYEHTIVRANLPRNRSMLSKMVESMIIPSGTYEFGICRPDEYRLLWALNHGSSSNLSSIAIFSVESLSDQLDTVMRLSLPLQLEISMPSDHWSQSVAMFREHSTAVADGHVTAVKEVEAKLKFLSTMTLVLPMVCASYVFLGGQITREEASGVVVSPKTIHSYPRLTPALQSTLFVLAVHSGIRSEMFNLLAAFLEHDIHPKAVKYEPLATCCRRLGANECADDHFVLYPVWQ